MSSGYGIAHGIDLGRAFTRARLGTMLRKLHVIADSKRTTDRSCTEYFFSVDGIGRIAANYQVDLPELPMHVPEDGSFYPDNPQEPYMYADVE